MTPPPTATGTLRVLLIGGDATAASALAEALGGDRTALDFEHECIVDVALRLATRMRVDVALVAPAVDDDAFQRVTSAFASRLDAFLVRLGHATDGEGAAAAIARGADDYVQFGPSMGAAVARALRQARLRTLVTEASARARRMELLAEVAGGVAHDFSNLIQVIDGHTSVLRETLPPGDGREESLDAIAEAGERAVRLVRQLLSLGADPQLVERTLRLDELVDGMRRILEGVMGLERPVTLELGCAGANVRVEPALLEQAILNLALNARHAMPAGGRLTVRTGRGALATAGESGVPAAVVEIVDEGCGMRPEVAERAFEPFFTTRGEREGSGLGLSSVIGVMQRFGGTAEIESAPGRGTTVRLLLPAVGEADTATAAKQTVAADEARSDERETILFVDDEPLVVTVVRKILERAGYRLVTAEGADEAETLFERHAEEIDLLVTDVVMPGRNGRELYECLRAKCPELPVVFVSGYVNDPLLTETMHDAERQQLVEKPFRAARLLSVVERVLHHTSTHVAS